MDVSIGLYGGSFNPIHLGHLISARSVAEQLKLDRVIFLPAASPPHKEAAGLLAAEHRAEMVRLAIADEPLFESSDFDLTRPGPSYTIETVMHFQQVLGWNAQIHWIIGADSLMELPTWYRVHALVDTCRIVTAARPGWDVIDWPALGRVFNVGQLEKLRLGVLETPRIDISATEIRHRVHQGRSIRFLIPEAVREYIERNGQYRD